MPKVTIIQPIKPDDSGLIRVAAYCRVSTNTADQHNSYTVQMEYYTHRFEASTTELLVGIYADEGISGTVSAKREDFQRMLRDCRKGKIDRIYTKSISRFTRNTKDCLQYIRELRTLGVSVYFEKENIDTGRITDEMMLTIMGGLAQEESTSLAQNMRWGVRKRMQNGTYKIGIPPYGYRRINGELVIEESEAAVVRQIYAWFLEGYGVFRITQMLNAAGYPTSNGLEKWGKAHVRYILSNERYTGDTVLQKTFMTDTVPFKLKHNHGELPKYYVSGTNVPIISKEDFDKVQALTAARKQTPTPEQHRYPLYRKLVCGCCGKRFQRTPSRGIVYWECGTHKERAANCPVKRIPEQEIYAAFVLLFNKLSCHFKTVLLPLHHELLELQSQEHAGDQRVSDIRCEIAALREQNHVLASLRTKGFLSAAKYQEQNTEIHNKIGRLQTELSRLLRTDDEDETVEQIGRLIRYFECQTTRLTEFDENAFTELVDEIVVRSRNELEFHLPGGVYLTEFI